MLCLNLVLPLANGVFLLLVVVVLMPGTLRAQSPLEEAVSHAALAEFDEALADFDAALAEGQLDHGPLVLLLRERALVAHAVGDNRRVDRYLSYLARIGSLEELDGRAPRPGGPPGAASSGGR